MKILAFRILDYRQRLKVKNVLLMKKTIVSQCIDENNDRTSDSVDDRGKTMT